jgi:uncharacterized membrane-anchored protein YhcB (DUF1043 family)
MNLLRVHNWQSALLALGIGLAIGAIVTVLMYFTNPVVSKATAKIAAV